MREALKYLTKEGLYRALENEGYSDNKFISIRYVGPAMNESQAMYETTYYDDNTGMVDTGKVFIWEEDDVLKGDF